MTAQVGALAVHREAATDAAGYKMQ